MTKDKQKKMIFWILLIIIFALLVAPEFAEKKKISDKKKEAIENYNLGIIALNEGNYSKAMYLFDDVCDVFDDYEYANVLSNYTTAVYHSKRADTNDEDCELAHIYIGKVNKDDLPPAMWENYERYKKYIDVRYKKLVRKREVYRNFEEKSHEATYPWVGLPEEFIENTKNGQGRFNTKSEYRTINGEEKRATIYEFYFHDLSIIIFDAVCVDGVVVETNSYFDLYPWIFYLSPEDYDNRYKAKKRNQNPKSEYENIKDYVNPEDFYDEYYADFAGFEDAEIYWEEFG